MTYQGGKKKFGWGRKPNNGGKKSVRLAGLWANQREDGSTYIQSSGKGLGEVDPAVINTLTAFIANPDKVSLKFSLYENTNKTKDSQPDFQLYISEVDLTAQATARKVAGAPAPRFGKKPAAPVQQAEETEEAQSNGEADTRYPWEAN